MRILLSDVLSVLLVVTSANLTFAESPWSRFHGVGGLGYVAEGEIPSTWTDEDYVWRHELETTDVGSPIVSEGKVYFWASLPTANEITLESLDLATGKRRWSKTFAHPSHHVHNRNTLASSTPAADAKNVFVAYADPEHTYLKCFDHGGNEIWSRDFGLWQSQHGFGTSPRIFGSMILLFNSQQANRLAPGKIPGQSRVIAVDRATGKTEWETSLSTTRSCYGIPATHVGANGRVQLIGANTGDGIFALDAESGEMLWNLEVFGKRSCSTPLVVGDLAIGSCGSGGGGNELVAVKIPVSANQKPEEAYRMDRAAPYVPTPAVMGGHMFTIADKGIASCLNVKSGEVIWSERIGGNFGASPIIVGDKLLLISLRGEATVLRAAGQFEKLGKFDFGGPVGATPAFSDGRLIVRVGNEIRCL
jgi:outer membrane protein assembly factor BamB